MAGTAVYAGGSVLRAGKKAFALAVRDGAIVAFDDDALALRGSGPEVDLAGGCLVPSFRDGHAHPLWGGVQLLQCVLAGARTTDEVRARIGAWAEAHPERAWVEGAGYDPSILPDGLGRVELLDDIVSDRPALLWAADHHSAWVNSRTLELAKIDDETPDPERGRIVRGGDGTAIGALLEDAAFEVAKLIPAPTDADRRGALRLALDRLVAHGITWVQDASCPVENVAIYDEVTAAGTGCRVTLAIRVEPDRWRTQLAEITRLRRDEGPLVIRTVKFFADGIIESGTAALLEPYEDDHTSCGIANWPAPELAEAAVAFDRAGFQLHIHAIGDGAVRTALDAIARVVHVNGVRDRRPVIAHAQVVHPADLPRFRALGVIANFEPLWAQRDPIMVDLTEPRLGPTRSAWQYPIGGLAALGTAVSFGSDWPVTSVDPLEGLAVAATRMTRDRTPPEGWLPEQRVTMAQAISAYTEGVAYQAFEEEFAGRIAIGQRADLCLLTADPLAIAPDEVADLSAVATWSAGSEVHRT